MHDDALQAADQRGKEGRGGEREGRGERVGEEGKDELICRGWLGIVVWEERGPVGGERFSLGK